MFELDLLHIYDAELVWCTAGVGPRPDPLPAVYTADLIPLIQRYGLCPHLYASDTQIYGFCRPSSSLELQNNITNCDDDVASWMPSNRLQLNSVFPRIEAGP